MRIPGFDPELWLNFNFNPERLKKMQNGADVINNFLKITLNQGLLRSDLLSKENLTELSTRLIDTQIPSAARRIKNLIDIQVTPANLLTIRHELSFLGHLAKYLTSFDQHSLETKLELWQTCGGTIAKDLVMKGRPVEDQWVVRTIEITKEDSLTARKLWYQGIESGLWVFTVDYAFGNQKLPETYQRFAKIGAKVNFYPGLTAGRVIMTETGYKARSNNASENKLNSIFELKSYLAKRYAHNVFEREIPIHLTKIILMFQNDRFYAVDEFAEMLEISSLNKTDVLWSKIANAGGKTTEILLIFAKSQFFLM